MKSLLFLFAFIVAFVCLTTITANEAVVSTDAEEQATNAANKKPTKKIKVGSDKWKGIKFDDIEKEWEKGDEKAELESEYDRLERIRAAKRPAVNVNDPKSMKRALNSGDSQSGSAMIFIDIKNDKKGKPHPEPEMRKLASRWTSMLQSGGLLVQVYHPGDSTILLHVDRGWLTRDVMKFAAMQKEVESITLNQKKYTPKECLKWLRDTEDDEDDDEL